MKIEPVNNYCITTDWGITNGIKTEFLKQMANVISEDKFAIANLKLFGYDPFTPLLTAEQFEILLLSLIHI